MKLARLLTVILFAQCALGGDCPTVVPRSSFIEEVLRIPEGSAKHGRAQIDPILRKDKGVLWPHDYRIDAEPAGTLEIAILEHKYVPIPLDFGEGTDESIFLHRKFKEENGDICYIRSRKIHNGRTEIVVWLERKTGDWDVSFNYTTDNAVDADKMARYNDDNMRSYIRKIAAELSKTEQAAP